MLPVNNLSGELISNVKKISPHLLVPLNCKVFSELLSLMISFAIWYLKIKFGWSAIRLANVTSEGHLLHDLSYFVSLYHTYYNSHLKDKSSIYVFFISLQNSLLPSFRVLKQGKFCDSSSISSKSLTVSFSSLFSSWIFINFSLFILSRTSELPFKFRYETFFCNFLLSLLSSFISLSLFSILLFNSEFCVFCSLKSCLISSIICP